MNYIDGCRVNVDRLSLVQVESRMAKNNGQEEKQKKLEKCRRALWKHTMLLFGVVVVIQILHQGDVALSSFSSMLGSVRN